MLYTQNNFFTFLEWILTPTLDLVVTYHVDEKLQFKFGVIKKGIIFGPIDYWVSFLVLLAAVSSALPLPGLVLVLLSTKEDFRGHYGRTFFLDMSPLFSWLHFLDTSSTTTLDKE